MRKNELEKYECDKNVRTYTYMKRARIKNINKRVKNNIRISVHVSFEITIEGWIQD